MRDLKINNNFKKHGITSKHNFLCFLKEDALKHLEDLVKKLPWTDPLKVWELNNSLKKKKTKRKKHNLQSPASREKLSGGGEEGGADQNTANAQEDCAQNPAAVEPAGGQDTETSQGVTSRNGLEEEEEDNEAPEVKVGAQAGPESGSKAGDGETGEGEEKVLRFRVTCNRAGDKHSFTSNEAARDFGGAVQEHFQWKADMTNFDVEVQCVPWEYLRFCCTEF